MKHASRIVLTVLSSLALAATVWASPQTTPQTSDSIMRQTPAETQTVSGTIASVQNDSFTLKVASSQISASEDSNKTKTMTFLIDRNTTVDGTLKVDSTADVTYRQENGSNLAISVHVTP
jgi:hypothetical protein